MDDCEQISDENDRNGIREWILKFRAAGYESQRAEKLDIQDVSHIDDYYVNADMEYISKNDNNIELISCGDDHYPNHITQYLNGKQPRKLFCSGELSLLLKPMIMICGARDASKTGCELSFRCGRQIAEMGHVLASGYARGIDIHAHHGALNAGGDTVAVLPFGFSRFNIRRQISEDFDQSHFLAVSELPPTCGFMTPFAFKRNKLLVALSKAVIVIEPGDSGGTWYSAQKAREMGKPLFFLEGDRGEMVARLEELGGRRLEVVNGAPKLGDVYAAGTGKA